MPIIHRRQLLVDKCINQNHNLNLSKTTNNPTNNKISIKTYRLKTLYYNTPLKLLHLNQLFIIVTIIHEKQITSSIGMCYLIPYEINIGQHISKFIEMVQKR